MVLPALLLAPSIPLVAVAAGAVAVLEGFLVETAGRGAVGPTPLGLLAVPEALRVAGVPSPSF